jgi:ParB family chromosome partitioning protein
MTEGKPRRLGKGLAALIGDGAEENLSVSQSQGSRRVPIEFLKTNPRNPRRLFQETDLEDLTASIREKGILQPILVRSISGMSDVFEIIAGERRWRAAQRAGLHEVPVLVVEADDQQSLELAIIENVQRSDLNPIEEAAGYEQLMAEFSYVQADVAKVIGKSRSHVTNTLRLLKLPTSVKQLVLDGQISAGHARALLSVADPEAVAKDIIQKGLNVRDVEKIAQHESSGHAAPDIKSVREAVEKDPDTLALEEALESILGLSVSLHHQAKGGEIRIRYQSLDQLESLCQRLRT